MDTTRFFTGKAIGTLVVMAVVIAYIGIRSLEKNEPPPSENYRATLAGEYLCLPAEVIDSTECIPGLRTETGEYYAVSFMLMSRSAPELEEGQFIRARGVVTPVETLSAAVWHRSSVVGIFSVTDSLEVR